MPKYKSLQTNQVNGDIIYNFGGLVPPVLFPDPTPPPSPTNTTTPSITPTPTPSITPTITPTPTIPARYKFTGILGDYLSASGACNGSPVVDAYGTNPVWELNTKLYLFQFAMFPYNIPFANYNGIVLEVDEVGNVLSSTICSSPTPTPTITPTPTNTTTPTPSITPSITPTITPSSTPDVLYQSSIVVQSCDGNLYTGGLDVYVNGVPQMILPDGTSSGTTGCLPLSIGNGDSFIYGIPTYNAPYTACTTPGFMWDRIECVNFTYNPGILPSGGFDYIETKYFNGVPVAPPQPRQVAINSLSYPTGCTPSPIQQWVDLSPVFYIQGGPAPSATPTPTPTITPTSNLNLSYQNVLNYANSQGYTIPSASGQTLQNNLIVSLQNAGIWNDLDIFYVMATDGDRNFAKLNWKNPSSFMLLENGSIDFTTNQGLKPTTASTSNYVNTQYNVLTNTTAYTQNNASRFAWDLNGNVSGNRIIDGHLSSSINRNQGGNNDYRVNSNTNPATAASFTGTGLKFVQRTAASGPSTNNAYLNGVLVRADGRSSFSPLPNEPLLLFRAFSNQTGGMIISIYGVGASLSGNEATLYNILNTYMSSL